MLQKLMDTGDRELVEVRLEMSLLFVTLLIDDQDVAS